LTELLEGDIFIELLHGPSEYIDNSGLRGYS
jgi:hypothetical protein